MKYSINYVKSKYGIKYIRGIITLYIFTYFLGNNELTFYLQNHYRINIL